METIDYTFFNNCVSLSDAARKIFGKDDYRSSEKIKVLSAKEGFDWHIWSERRKKKRVIVKCVYCGKEFEIDESEKLERKFCSHSCSASYNNKARGAKEHTQYEACVYCGKSLNGKSKYAKYCSVDCQKNMEQKEYIAAWKDGKTNGVIGKYGISNRIRTYLFEKYNCKCQKCGWGEENPKTHKVPLQIHHIDGNCLNNNEDNLQLLCPNCHSLTDTFGNSNKNSKRVFRRQKENELD